MRHEMMPAAPAEPSRPFPGAVLDRWAPHFDALAAGRLAVRRCDSCHALQWPPRVCCRRCTGMDFSWVDAATEGSVYTYTVCHRAFHPWFMERTPFGLVVADVEPGVKVLGNCFGDAVAALECGVAVRAELGLRVDGRVMLCWEPVT